MALLLPHTFAFSVAFGHSRVLLLTKALKEEAWVLKYAFSMFVVKLYGFCLSIAYIARRRHPIHKVSTDSLINAIQYNTQARESIGHPI